MEDDKDYEKVQYEQQTGKGDSSNDGDGGNVLWQCIGEGIGCSCKYAVF